MINSMMAAAVATALTLTSTVSVPAIAVQAASDTAVDSTKKLPDGTTPAERANTARLNAEQAAKAKADNITYQQEVSAAAQQVAHDQAEFVDDTAVYEMEKARIAALSAEERVKYEAEVAAWKADVAACKAGETHRCAKPKPTLPPQD